VGRLKPAPEPYVVAAERLGVAVDQVRLIAAHAWDVAGAALTVTSSSRCAKGV
jgi:2-haloacid dehalogenase